MEKTATTGDLVVGVDGSAAAHQAVRWAARAAAGRGTGLRIVYAGGLEGGYFGAGLPIPREALGELRRQAGDVLAEAEKLAREAAPGLAVATELSTRLPIPVLLEAARTARMVVLGAEGAGGFDGMRIGSTAVAVASHAGCPVVVVRGQEVPDGRRLVVGVDGSPTSEAALAAAFEEASWRRAPLIAAHAWTDVDYDSATSSSRLLGHPERFAEDGERLLAQRLAGWQERYPDVPVERDVVRDRPRHRLLELAAGAALVVVGSRGRGGIQGLLLGSTSQALIQHAQCPVMIVCTGRPE
ncbi:universal stress protein [Amycolatopsis cihanbeyliensis]|uniref:Nucleotide-binding universal stress UspA family protein n=1 Tax=Amycolatopsis cihanbeyliensis TaxID=1128664 RepID=A0A542DDZ3_AMYCI|nr:universal stress protein [Amycolatopsis cihanbeyliensis]TQJ01294.1 nucleotide-binding universal stress UspA family protein [Amycolatopsis cihanbeyliensis]